MIAEGQGRRSLCSLNATRRVFHLPPVPHADGMEDCSVCSGMCRTPDACLLPERIERRLFTSKSIAPWLGYASAAVLAFAAYVALAFV